MKRTSVKRKVNRSDNRGSSLIAVMVCVSLIGILGLTMIMLSSVNMQMKMVERRSSSNFYDAESAVNEICTGLQNVSEQKLYEAMSYTETYYAATPSAERSNLLNRRYAELFYDYLKTDAAGSSAASVVDGDVVELPLKGEQAERLLGYLESLAEGGVEVSVSAASEAYPITVLYDKNEHYVEIQNLSVTCTSVDGYESTVTTDVRFAPPKDYFTVNQSTDADIFNTYMIIADGNITASGVKVAVTGNIYAGNDITVNNGAGFSIYAENITARGSLNARGNSQMNILPDYAGGFYNCEVWVKNILTTPNSRYASVSAKTGRANISIIGDCYVADDLVLSNPGYNVNIDGNYYGYHTGAVQDSADSGNDGSSVAINAAYADLTVAAKDGQTLWIAGKDTLDAVNDDEGGDSDIVVKEGESLTYKWTQNAYMIPGSCIPSADAQNPMPAATYESLTSGGKQIELDFSNYPFINQINLNDYLDAERPYIARYVQQYDSGAQNMVYLYMNFTSEDSAAEYFNTYASYITQRTALSAAADILGYGKVNLNKSVLSADSDNVHTGNIVMFDTDDTGSGSDYVPGSVLNINDNNYTSNRTGTDAETSEEAEYDPFLSEDGSSVTSINPDMTHMEDESTEEEGEEKNYTRSYSPYGSLTIVESNASSLDPAVLDMEIESTYQYNGLISVLNKNAYSGYPSYNLVSYILDDMGLDGQMNVVYKAKSAVKEGEEPYTVKSLGVKGTGSSRYIEVSASSIAAVKSKYTGIVVADCDVYVKGGFTFNGLIITTGNVILEGGATLRSGAGLSIGDIASSDAEDSKTSPESTSVVFRNWKKN